MNRKEFFKWLGLGVAASVILKIVESASEEIPVLKDEWPELNIEDDNMCYGIKAYSESHEECSKSLKVEGIIIVKDFKV